MKPPHIPGSSGFDNTGNTGQQNNMNTNNITLGLYDEDGDLVVLSDSIPNDSMFTVRPPFFINPMNIRCGLWIQ